MTTRALVGVALAGALAGCVPIPLPRSEAAADVDLPDVRPHLPIDLQKSNSEILVLAQTARSHHATLGSRARSGGTFLSAEFTKGTELESLKDRFQLRSSRHLLFVGVLTPSEHYHSDLLKHLCLVTSDGRIYGLTPGDATWVSSREVRLDVSLVAAFADGIRTPPQRGGINWIVDPCGASGDVTWSASLRSKVDTFLARIARTP
jgi:hypothetical protein